MRGERHRTDAGERRGGGDSDDESGASDETLEARRAAAPTRETGQSGFAFCSDLSQDAVSRPTEHRLLGGGDPQRGGDLTEGAKLVPTDDAVVQVPAKVLSLAAVKRAECLRGGITPARQIVRRNAVLLVI
jgi:hypothetical protein